MLMLTDSAIPQRLQDIPNPPTTLYVRGESLDMLLKHPCIAIVGSRHVTPYGRDVTARFASELASQGVVVVSGLALGVDAIAHRAALDAGGLTIAVLPSSVDTVYPSTNANLAKQIISSGGALVSEYPMTTRSFKANFVQRNRLVSGISDALLVTEAAKASGTMHTVRFARAQGKTVFAIPGNITSPLSIGTNLLIQQGALSALSAADIIRTLGIAKAPLRKALRSEDPFEQAVLRHLEKGTRDGGELLAASELSAAQFAQAMTMLEIKGIVTALGNNQWGLA
jgi:DNA processing protein